MGANPVTHPRKVLVANREEIAVRCIRVCKELGITSIATFTNADTTSLHAPLADEAVLLPGADSRSYTDGEPGDAILDICSDHFVDAAIPGSGFRSENIEFVTAVEAAGMIFVGPWVESVKAMGLKHEARAIAEAANVPTSPGTPLISTAEETLLNAHRLGTTVMLKAINGGGGMGLQLVVAASCCAEGRTPSRPGSTPPFGHLGYARAQVSLSSFLCIY
ncbi:hypothetical protein FDECE_15789 [Fusarium decemcellulare]|nr:hypothetical protein FDECE_15789 [Fusarium decemcellulare]